MTKDPFEIAVEHIAWCLLRGWHVNDVFAALCERPPQNARWHDAIWVVAKAQESLADVRQGALKLVA